MFRRIWTALTLTLAAGTLAMGLAHVLEFPAKADYDDRLYAAVNSTLYWGFAAVGAPVMVGGILAAVVQCFLQRGRRAFRMTVAGAACLAVALVAWAALVYPVNAEVARTWSAAVPGGAAALPPAARRQPPPEVIAAWHARRTRWESGHAVSFAFVLAGFVLLAIASTAPAARQPPVSGGQ
jgi:hypothetical protein